MAQKSWRINNFFMNHNYRSIELNLRIGCPINCSYCPQSKFLKSDYGKNKTLSVDYLKRIIDNATEDKHLIEVYFAGFSEPLALKDWRNLVSLCEATELVYRYVIFTTGYQITEDDLIFLANCKKVHVNFHVGEKTMMPNFDDSIWQKLGLIKKYLPNSCFLEVGFNEKDFEGINEKLNKHKLNHKFQEIISRSGNLQSVGLIQLNVKKSLHPVTCDKLHEKKRPVVLPDGTALACTNDYGCEMKIGNLYESKWSSLDFERIINLQKNCSSDLPCFRDCHFAVKGFKKLL